MEAVLADKAVYNIFQYHNESNTDYINRFCALVEASESYNGDIARHLGVRDYVLNLMGLDIDSFADSNDVISDLWT